MNDDHGELSSEARALIAISRDGDQPNADDRARVRAKLLASIAGGAVALSAAKAAASGQIGAASSVSTAATAGSAGASGVFSAKLAAGVLAIALATAGTGVVVMRATQRTPAAQHEVERAAPAHAQPAPAEPVTEPEPSAARSATRVSERAPAAVTPNATAPIVAPPPQDRDDVAAARTDSSAVRIADADGIAPRTDSAAQRTVDAAPRKAPLARSPTTRVRRTSTATHARAAASKTEAVRAEAGRTSETATAPAVEQQPEPTPSLRRELALIAAAQAALTRNAPDEALRWLDAHVAGYPAGELVEERLAARAVALCALGRAADGRRAAADLTRLAPNSPLLGRARRACAAHAP